MPRLIISNDTIDFMEEGIRFTGHVARLIADGQVIFIIKYARPDINSEEMRRIKRNFCESSKRFLWVNYPGNEHDRFIQIIGEEIEKRPHLMASA